MSSSLSTFSHPSQRSIMKPYNGIFVTLSFLAILGMVEAQGLSLPSCAAGCPADVCPGQSNVISCLCGAPYDMGYCIGYNCGSANDEQSALRAYDSFCGLASKMNIDLILENYWASGSPTITNVPTGTSLPTAAKKNSGRKSAQSSYIGWFYIMAVSLGFWGALF